MTANAMILAVLALAGPVLAQSPRLAIEERAYDFGTVERGTIIEHTFRLANGGDAQLRIDHLKSTCGCTVAVASARDVPPGGEGRVTVTLDTARMAGRTTKIVTVYSNDADVPVLGLTLSGTVTADLAVMPSPLYLGRIRRGDPTRREVLITPGGTGAPYTVTAVEHTNPALHTRLEPRSDGPGQRLVVDLDRDIPLGRFNEQLTLRTTSPREPVMTVAVFGSVEGDVVVLPPQVTFGTTSGSGPAPEREVFIRTRGSRPVTVTKVAVPDVVTYTLSPVQEGVEYRLTLRLREGLRPGKVEGVVEIFTDHPDESHLVVPLYAIIGDGRRGGRG